jgi:hypothetical protein
LKFLSEICRLILGTSNPPHWTLSPGPAKPARALDKMNLYSSL